MKGNFSAVRHPERSRGMPDGGEQKRDIDDGRQDGGQGARMRQLAGQELVGDGRELEIVFGVEEQVLAAERDDALSSPDNRRPPRGAGAEKKRGRVRGTKVQKKLCRCVTWSALWVRRGSRLFS